MNATIDIGNTILKTSRLILRPWEKKDLNDFFEYASVEGVGEGAGWPHHKSIDVTKEVLDMFINDKKTFAIEYKNKVIGSLGIEQYDEEAIPELKDKKTREIGFVLSKDYWGMGLATEAVNEVIKYLFEEAKLDVIVCSNYVDNTRSARVQEKCGFEFFKTYQRQTEFTSGQCIVNIKNNA